SVRPIPSSRGEIPSTTPRAEFSDGLLDGGPFAFSSESIINVGEHRAGVIFHDVHLAACGPADARRGAERPERRPASELRVNAGAHLELAVGELAQTARREAGGGAINPFAAGLPIRAVRGEV